MASGDFSIARIHDGPLDYDQIFLERIKFRIEQRISREFMESVKIETWREQFGDDLAVALTAYVLAEKTGVLEHEIDEFRTATVWVPKSWWQHLKLTVYRTKKLSWRTRNVLTKIFRPGVEVPITKTVHFRETVKLEPFPASPIKTPEKFRGPITVPFERAL